MTEQELRDQLALTSGLIRGWELLLAEIQAAHQGDLTELRENMALVSERLQKLLDAQQH